MVAGMFRTANGIGRAALSCYRALCAEGLDPIAVDLSGLFNQVDVASPVPLQEMPVNNNGTLVLYANAPETERALMGLGLRRWHKWRIIGAWAWELATTPADWARQTCYLSEIWAPSRFVQQTFESQFALPVRTVPHYLPVHAHANAWPTPASRGDTTLRVLTIADGRSSFHRKNLLATMQMFSKAFPNNEPVHLTVKCRNLSLYKYYESAVMAYANKDPRIDVIDRSFSEEEQTHLLWNSDIVVSSHRAEGFGMHLAEAMAAGRATMATGWSGNLEFMTAQNSTLLPYVLKLVDDPSGIYKSMPDARWADVNIDAGSLALRELYDSPRKRHVLATTARRDVSASLRSRTYSEALGILA
ncbi:putative glycosyl transferase [Hyphomonas johnsonii MHS-2]|uniref:Putative glycosyl transferase n=2 Tax=Hyphomonas johnsonii TaxID=81031 RepID=A0A059FAD4_9PROT|nr:putative glycosyl transferase [Hyphomonas johnsonii MHS-2]